MTMRSRKTARGIGAGIVAVALWLGAAPSSAGGFPREALFHDPRLPLLLSQTGLYDRSGSLDSRNQVYVPQYPLWSDGSAKSRWIRLPEGSTIDVSDVDAWRFPVGTRLWKEFAWDGRKVETRMLWRVEEEWLFAAYVWTEDQTDAHLAPPAGIRDVHELAPGKKHSIPGLADCHSCHRSSPAIVLGFGALQLSDDRDPLAPHAEPLPPGALTLASLVQADLLVPPRPELALDPPRIRETSATARAAVGYLAANCGGCHNPVGPIAHLGLNLFHDVGALPGAPEPVRATAIDRSGRFVVPGVSADDSRLVAPGVPERSAILHRMASRRPSSQMPPLGSVLADEEALGLIRRWIEELDRVPSHGVAALTTESCPTSTR